MLSYRQSRHAHFLHGDVEHDTQRQNPIFDRGHVSDMVSKYLSHIFTPMAYQQCTSSELSRRETTTSVSTTSPPYRMIIDDDYALIDEIDSQDGGPLHREATIASWKATKTSHQKERKRSRQWLGSVIMR